MIKITKEEAEQIAKELVPQYPNRIVKVVQRVRDVRTFYAVKIY